MKDGFVKIACCTPEIKVADCDFNTNSIIHNVIIAHEHGAKIIAFPELCVTGYTCGDLFLQDCLLQNAKKSIEKILENTTNLDIISIVGCPFLFEHKLFNCAVVIFNNKILGIVPKIHIPNYTEFYELRHFSPWPIDEIFYYNFSSQNYRIAVGQQKFRCKDFSDFTFGIEICEDLWVADSPSVKLAQLNANIIFNLSASNEIIGKKEYRKTLINAKSGSLCCAYAYVNAGNSESSTDLVFSGHSLISENASIIAESELYTNSIIYADIDVKKLAFERRRMNTFSHTLNIECGKFEMQLTETRIERFISPTPFVPSANTDRKERCEDILNLQVSGLNTRLKNINCKSVVIGISGGLDSTLALLIVIRTFKKMDFDFKNIIAVTMPCFGTTSRTYDNARKLANSFGVTLLDIDIADSVIQHFKDISHNKDTLDIVFENSQARERTQVLMDLANKYNALVIGTGDLSEMALGWSTYNGDHMSMYAVNCSVPKTLIRHLVAVEAENNTDSIKSVLIDILDTPVSPELLPPKDSEISQETEKIVGPYELHDFFLYYMLRWGFSPSKIFRLAKIAFAESYTDSIIVDWLKVFYRRFFANQFKRSCVPDGPKIGTVSLSPRGDWRMPSDVTASIWIKDLENL
ncbi:NAD(+) synthase [Clostridia bacterium]|nr:NAD(+) synthase [Clostridia bacterium]